MVYGVATAARGPALQRAKLRDKTRDVEQTGLFAAGHLCRRNLTRGRPDFAYGNTIGQVNMKAIRPMRRTFVSSLAGHLCLPASPLARRHAGRRLLSPGVQLSGVIPPQERKWSPIVMVDGSCCAPDAFGYFDLRIVRLNRVGFP
jgi:hypothetical protein